MNRDLNRGGKRETRSDHDLSRGGKGDKSTQRDRASRLSSDERHDAHANGDLHA